MDEMELDDKVLLDLGEREKKRESEEDDILDELKIYDLRVIEDYVCKMAKKMLGLFVVDTVSTLFISLC